MIDKRRPTPYSCRKPVRGKQDANIALLNISSGFSLSVFFSKLHKHAAADTHAYTDAYGYVSEHNNSTCVSNTDNNGHIKRNNIDNNSYNDNDINK